MSKYCANCGKLLPDGVDLCPDCRVEGVENEAAPFTKITAATEDWKEEKPVREKKRPSQIRPYLYAAIAVIVIAAAAFLIISLQPANRVIRALNAGDYDRAMEIYWSDGSLSAGEGADGVKAAALRAAQEVTERFKKRELDADAASEALGKLGTFDEALMQETYDEFRALLASREHFEKGNRLFEQGDYLAAREEYLLVTEDDPDHAKAQTYAADCIEEYVDGVLAGANVLIQTGDYAAAIETLKNGDRALLAVTLYSEKIDYKLKACYELYEEHVLTEAERLAALGDYAAAAALISQSMERYDFETEALAGAMEDYLALARDKALSEAAARADELYSQGDSAAAFAALEELSSAPDTDAEALAAAVAALESRFSDDKIAEAKTIYANTRENLDEAIAILTAALRVRATDALSDYKDELSRYLPASLAELRYAEKDGIIFRSASAFEGLDGVEYTGGWVWGEDGASLTFQLDGAYDRLTGTLAVRRDDGAEAGGYFELWCDGELAYRSETLHHWETVPIEVDAAISGCGELVVRFYNDYNISTSEDGYCYHGLCDGELTKNIPVQG